MAIALPTGYIRTTVEPLDALYLDNTVPAALVPYPTTTAANTAITINQRYLGLFVNIDNGTGGSTLYWYKDGVTNGDLVPFSAGGGGSTFINPNPTTIGPVGGYQLGDTFPVAQTMQQMWDGLLYPYVQPTMNGGLTPTSSAFNAQNVTITGTLAGGGGGPWFFTWTKNPGSVDLVSATIEYRRGGGGGWTPLATTTQPPTYAGANTVDVNTTGAFIINQAGIDNGTLEMRCAFTDLNGSYFSSVISSSFAIYAAPSITNLFNDPTPGFAAGTYKLIKNFTPYSSTYITGTINRNSPLVNITGYDIEYSSNGSTWTVLPGGPYAGGAGATVPIAPYTDSLTSIAGTTAYWTRLVTSDTAFPTLTPIANSTINIGDYTIYNPVFAGFISSATFALGAPYNLTNVVNLSGYQTLVPNGSNNNGNASGGTCNYTNTAADKALFNLLFQSSAGDHFIIAYPAAYGPLTYFGDNSNNFLSSPGAYTLTTQAVTNLTGGGSVSYNVYVQFNANSAATFPAYKMY
jgi:hypothetical protein